MYSEEMYELGTKPSAIRELFMYGRMKAAELGEEHVYDFSLGSPSVPAPDCVKEAIIELLDHPKVHSYTPAQGDIGVRKAIAGSISQRFHIEADPNKLYITCGAAASLTCTIRAITNPSDEWIVFAPFFPEYRFFIESAKGKCLVSQPDPATLEIDFEDLEKQINSKTKALIINSPNNPSGVVYSKETIVKLSELLDKKSEEFGRPIYLISDEPYREIVYGDVEVPYVPKYYKDTIVCYSYSKSFSLAGERIGYIFVNNDLTEADAIYASIAGAGRSMGYVCAPSMFQKVVEKCVDAPVNVEPYRANRDLLKDALVKYGYECVEPEGAFYLFVKTPIANAEQFCEHAKLRYNLLLVPSNSFGLGGYMRISYCVDGEMIKRSLPSFEALMKDFK